MSLPLSITTVLCMVIGGAVSLITLHIGTRMGIHDVRRWITPDMRLQLRAISFGWQIMAVAAACIVAWAAVPWVEGLAHEPASQASFALMSAIAAMFLCGVFAGLLATLARIDIACRLLPDRLTLVLLATGIAFHGLVGAVHPIDAIVGAVVGYGALWLLAWGFNHWRNTEAMGRGDFAMTAGLGAWLGWQSLPLMLIVASAAALMAIAACRIAWPVQGDPPSGEPAGFLSAQAAFGPALAVGGIAAWIALGAGATLD